jgi:hypothetical protein
LFGVILCDVADFSVDNISLLCGLFEEIMRFKNDKESKDNVDKKDDDNIKKCIE